MSGFVCRSLCPYEHWTQCMEIINGWTAHIRRYFFGRFLFRIRFRYLRVNPWAFLTLLPSLLKPECLFQSVTWADTALDLLVCTWPLPNRMNVGPHNLFHAFHPIWCIFLVVYWTNECTVGHSHLLPLELRNPAAVHGSQTRTAISET